MRFRPRTALAVLVAVLAAMAASAVPAFAAEEKPFVETEAATNITSIEAQLHGVVNPEGFVTHYHFEYGTTKSYGKSTTSTSAGHGTSNVEVSATLTGLTPHVTYQYRIVAENANGVVDGANMQFTTFGTPEFKPAIGQSITGSTGTVKFSLYGGTITCSKGATIGGATGASTASKIVITLTGCKGKTSGGTECEERTSGAKSEEMVSQPLKGQLGIVTTNEASSGVGLYVEAEAEPSNATWFQDAEVCIPDPKIYGTAAAEVVTIGKKQLTNELVFAPGKIKKLTLASGKTAEPELLGWNFSLATIEATDNLTFGEATEVT